MTNTLNKIIHNGDEYELPEGFSPDNAGTTDDVLTKTANGYEWSAPSGGATDHLEEEGIVGEAYTLSNELFEQQTPTLADSALGQNIGDSADNTQIHIQRIGSGTASNSLKLKLKKVGTPGDLTVKVMKGIKVEVSTSEAYWYGDSSNIISSGSISASDITTTWGEITVTLDSNFGGTEGELLDVVLYMSSVNASNYYILGCDNTQWSEGFSLVKVNGNTRSREKIMPYCISNGFLEKLMCKFDGTNTIQFTDLVTSFSGTITVSPYGKTVQYSGTATTTNYSYTISGGQSGRGTSLYIWVNGTTIASVSYGNSTSGTFTCNIGDTIEIGVEHQQNYTLSFNYSYVLNGVFDVPKQSAKSYMPRSLESIGDKVSVTLLGLHIDGTRSGITNDTTGTTNTVTGIRAGDENDLPATPNLNTLYFCY